MWQPSLWHTWLDQSHVKDLVHLAVVSRDMEDELRVVPDTGDVDRDQVLADLLPLDGAAAAGGDVEHLRPQSATVKH